MKLVQFEHSFVCLYKMFLRAKRSGLISKERLLRRLATWKPGSRKSVFMLTVFMQKHEILTRRKLVSQFL